MRYQTRPLTYLLLAIVATVSFAFPGKLHALELNRIFSNDMVLQRDKPVTVWGTAKKGEKVTVTFAGQTVKATADNDGRWAATLKPMPANAKPQTLTVSSSISNLKSQISNLLIGDVFLFARQSSIDVSLGSTPAGKKAAAGAKGFRFIRIKASPSRTLLDNLKEDATAGWQVADRKSALAMSASAFYLGRDLAKDIDVPLGIVDLDMGYHFGAAWLSHKGAELAKETCSDLANELRFQPLDYEAWDKRIVPRKRGGPVTGEPSDKPLPGFSPIQKPICPSVCYNAVVHPLRGGLVVKGMLLQLGNDYPYFSFRMLPRKHANSSIYNTIKQGNRMTPQALPAAVKDLRSNLGGDASLPLAWIMPPGSDVDQYGTHNREVREVQRRTVAKSKGIDLILPGAEHVNKSGQPADEALLADRCRQWVMGTFYGAKGPVTGPVLDRIEFKGWTATVHFKAGTAEGLSAKDDALQHFEAAGEEGEDGEFVPCKAQIEGTTIKLTCATEAKPQYLRYNWTRKPVQGLVNSAGLPALPFNTDTNWVYDWWPASAPVVLPEEYRTTVNKWPARDILIHNGQNYLHFGRSATMPHIGPTGIWAAPFGPNLYVHKITPGSPADGKVFKDDMIYGVNGKDFTNEHEDHYRGMAAGITRAETKAGGGKMILNIRRNRKLIEVPIELEVMGSFSDTSPWNCEKSKRIVKKAEEYMRTGLRPGTGIPDTGTYAYGPWNDNILFLMASGNPELQGLVRRYIHQVVNESFILKESERRPRHDNRYNINVPLEKGGVGWEGSYLVLLLGEYYHRTGDAYVLPYLEYLVHRIQFSHIKMHEADPANWPPTAPSGYGTHPAGQMPSTMGILLANEAGLKVDQHVMRFALNHLHEKRAENGFILYCGYGPFLVESRQIDEPAPMDPQRKERGTIGSMNGKLGTGAALFSMVEGADKAVNECSTRCVYSFNKTRFGHGGTWFNNFWTPIGALHAGDENFKHFMKGQQWYRELYRDHTGAIWQSGNAKRKSDWLAVGYATHRVAHHKRLRILGGPRTAFATNPPAYLKDALAAHRKRDYALAEKLIQKVLAKGKIPDSELPMVKHFLETVQTLQKSIVYDLAYTEDAIKRGEYYLANLELPQLKMVVASDNARLKAIAATLESDKAKAQMADVLAQAQQEEHRRREEAKAKKPAPTITAGAWTDDTARLVTLVKEGKCTFAKSKRARVNSYPEEEWNIWRLAVFETRDHVPEKWEQPDYDDSEWEEITLPTCWRPGHAALLRTTFDVEDVNALDGLQVRAAVYKQKDLQIYLNGHVVAKANAMNASQMFNLTPYATSLLKNGRNTLAVTAQHGARWVDFSFRLEGRLKVKKVAGK